MLKDVRWGRGFFRLWVALSALWIVLLCAILWQPIVNPLPLGSGYLISPITAAPIRFPRYSSQWTDAEARVRSGELHQTQIEFFGRIDTAIFSPAAATDAERERMFEAHRVRVVEDRKIEILDVRKTNISNLLMLTMIPVLGALSLGLIVRWIIKGFSHQAAA